MKKCRGDAKRIKEKESPLVSQYRGSAGIDRNRGDEHTQAILRTVGMDAQSAARGKVVLWIEDREIFLACTFYLDGTPSGVLAAELVTAKACNLSSDEKREIKWEGTNWRNFCGAPSSLVRQFPPLLVPWSLAGPPTPGQLIYNNFLTVLSSRPRRIREIGRYGNVHP